MPDVFDEIAPDKPKDIFDEIAPSKPPRTSASKDIFDTVTPSKSPDNITSLARAYKSTPYKFGGEDACKGSDCSSFSQQVMRRMGVNLPRTAEEQFSHGSGRAVSASTQDLQPGDLLFKKGTYGDNPGKITHVGVYLGNGLVANMQSTKTGYQETPLKNYLAKSYAGAMRYLPDRKPVPQYNSSVSDAAINSQASNAEGLSQFGQQVGQAIGSDVGGPVKAAGMQGGILGGAAQAALDAAAQVKGMSQKEKTALNTYNAAQDLGVSEKEARQKGIPQAVQGGYTFKPSSAINQLGPVATDAKTGHTGYIAPDSPVKAAMDTALGPGTYDQFHQLKSDKKGIAGQLENAHAGVAQFVTGLVEPENAALLYLTAGAGAAAPVLKPLIGAAFAGMMGKGAYDKAQEGDYGGAAVLAAAGLLAGMGAKTERVKYLRDLKEKGFTPEQIAQTVEAAKTAEPIQKPTVRVVRQTPEGKPVVRIIPKGENNGIQAKTEGVPDIPETQPESAAGAGGPVRGTETEVGNPTGSDRPVRVSGEDRPSQVRQGQNVSDGGKGQAEEVTPENLSVGDRTTSVKHATIDQEMQDAGRAPITRQEAHPHEDVMEGAKAQNASDPNYPRKLAREVKQSNRAITVEEQASLLEDRGRIIDDHAKAEQREAAAIQSGDEPGRVSASQDRIDLEQAFNDNAEAIRHGRSEVARTLGFHRDVNLDDDMRLLPVIARATRKKGAPLTPEETTQYKVLSAAYEKAQSELAAKIDELQKQVAAKEAGRKLQQVAEREAKQAGRTSTKESLDKELSDLVEQWRARKGPKPPSSLKMGLDPTGGKYNSLEAKDIFDFGMKYLKNRAKVAGNSIGSIVDGMHSVLKEKYEDITHDDIAKILASRRTGAATSRTVTEYQKLKQELVRMSKQGEDTPQLKTQKKATQKRIDEMQRRLKEGDFLPEPARIPVRPDEALKNLQEKEALLRETMKAKINSLEKKTPGQRVSDYQRAAVLSGLSVFEKLGGASVWAFPVESLADMFGYAAGKVKVRGKSLSSITEGVQGRTTPISSVERVRGALSREALVNARGSVTKGMNAIDALAGEGGHGQGNELSSYIGRSHGAMKAFLQTGEYRRAMMDGLKEAHAAGKDISNPQVQMEVGMRAAVEAQNMILKADNPAAQAINRIVGSVEKYQGKHKGAAMVRAAGTILRTLVPVTRVATNYLGRSIDMTGFGLARAAGEYAHARYDMAKAGSKGAPIEMTPEQATSIIKAVKYGGVGLLAMYLGLTQPAGFESGGFYEAGGKKKGAKEPLSLNLFGMEVPHILAHSPFANAVQFWATIRNGFDKGQEREGAYHAVMGMAEQIPGVESTRQIFKGMDSPTDFAKAAGGYVNTYNPQAVQQVGQYMDRDEKGNVIKRKPRNFTDTLKMGGGVVGLRQQVPTKGGRTRTPRKSR